jgi:ribonuclease E
MSKAMLINVTHPEEGRVAIVDNGVLDGFEIDTVQRGQIKGNIYKATVRNVNPALQACFVEFGGLRDGFLPLDEVNFQVLPQRSQKGKSKGKGHRIEDHLAPGMEVIVQVVKDKFANKPPTLSTFISLPGRFLVLTPDSDAGGISRKIEDSQQRDRLKRILSELKAPEGAGIIVRTAGIDQTKTELSRDLRYLVRLWQNIQRAAKKHKAPALLYQERDLALRTIRDYLTSDIGQIWIDNEDVFERATKWFKAVMPTKTKLLKLYDGAGPLFSKYNLEDQIEQIFKRKVPLSSGGAIVIDSTEALTAIDVNSGKYKKGGSLEDTALQTNLEAAAEICRQLRLRDLGGIVVIDFIDMRSRKNMRSVEKIVRDALRGDKAKHDVTSISKLGLMEISRQRLKSTKAASAYVDCEVCGGDGAVRAVESAALVALRKIHTVVAKGSLEAVQVVLPHDVAIHLLNTKREEIQQLEDRHKCHILVTVRDDLKRDGLEIVESKRGAPPAAERPAEKDTRKAEGNDKRRRRKTKAAPARATSPAVTDDDLLEEGALDEDQEDGSPAKSKRRRRKPRSRKAAGKAAAAGKEPAEEEGAEDEAADVGGESGTTKKRRRRRRGGRGRRSRPREGEAGADENGASPDEGAGEGAPEQVEVLVPGHSGEEPYLPPSIAAQASEAEHADDKGSWWERFRRVLRSSGTGHAPEE